MILSSNIHHHATLLRPVSWNMYGCHFLPSPRLGECIKGIIHVAVVPPVYIIMLVRVHTHALVIFIQQPWAGLFPLFISYFDARCCLHTCLVKNKTLPCDWQINIGASAHYGDMMEMGLVRTEQHAFGGCGCSRRGLLIAPLVNSSVDDILSLWGHLLNMIPGISNMNGIMA